MTATATDKLIEDIKHTAKATRDRNLREPLEHEVPMESFRALVDELCARVFVDDVGEYVELFTEWGAVTVRACEVTMSTEKI